MHTLFSVGLRPFFLMAGFYGAVSMLAWLGWLGSDIAGFRAYLGASQVSVAAWHGHEMLFGFAAAVIAGFMLTAVPNWTGSAPLAGAPLALLAALWLAGRVAMWLPGTLPPAAAAVLDLAFLPALGLFVAGPLIRARAWRNMVFLVLLAVLVAANVLFHIEAAGYGPGSADLAGMGNLLALDLVLVLITIVGGRIIPAFTGNWLKAQGIDAPLRTSAPLDGLTIAATAAVLIADVAAPGGFAAGTIALIACLLHFARLTGWRSRLVLGSPIMWILHLGYCWLVAGFAVKAVALLTGTLPHTAALHALTAGAVGSMTLGVMSRAALGHTGRELRVAPAITLAYVMVSLAALIRVAGPSLLPDTESALMLVSGSLWALAFAVFTLVYFPILARPPRDS